MDYKYWALFVNYNLNKVSIDMVENKTLTLNNEFAKNAPICNCCEGTDEKERVLYICWQPTCPLFTKQKLYCLRCSEEGLHEHKILKIVNKFQTIQADWNALKEQVDAGHNNA